jgi:hypothetical protein
MKDNVGVSQGCPWVMRRRVSEFTLDSIKIPRFMESYDMYIQQMLANTVPTEFDDFLLIGKKLASKIVFNEENLNNDIFNVFSEANSLWILVSDNYEISQETNEIYQSYLKKHIKNPNKGSLIWLAKNFHPHKTCKTTTTQEHELIHHIPHWIFPIVGLIPTTFARMILLLCNHPTIFDKLEQSIKNGDKTFLRKCLLETLRLNNPVVTTFRTLLENYRYRSYYFDKGDQFLILNNAVLRDPEYFKQPDLFIPDRWTPEMEKSYYAISFNQGPQICPAKEFALNLLMSFTTRFLIKSNFKRWNCETIDVFKIPQMIDPCKIKFT